MTLASKFTIARIVLVPVFLFIAALGFPGWNIWAAVVYIVASLTDTIDGHIARHYNQISDFGKLVDPIADKLLTSAAMCVLVGWGKMPGWVAMILITRDVIVSAFRILAANRNIVLAARNSGKIKTVLQIVAYCAYLFGVQIVGHIVIAAATLVTVYSLYDYIYANRSVLTRDTIGPFVRSFLGQLLTAYAIFWLLSTMRMHPFVAMIFIGCDNIVSAISVTSSSKHRPIALRLSGVCMRCVEIILLVYSFAWKPLLGTDVLYLLLLLICIGAVVWHCLDVWNLSRTPKNVRVQ